MHECESEDKQNTQDSCKKINSMNAKLTNTEMNILRSMKTPNIEKYIKRKEERELRAKFVEYQKKLEIKILKKHKQKIKKLQRELLMETKKAQGQQVEKIESPVVNDLDNSSITEEDSDFELEAKLIIEENLEKPRSPTPDIHKPREVGNDHSLPSLDLPPIPLIEPVPEPIKEPSPEPIREPSSEPVIESIHSIEPIITTEELQQEYDNNDTPEIISSVIENNLSSKNIEKAMPRFRQSSSFTVPSKSKGVFGNPFTKSTWSPGKKKLTSLSSQRKELRRLKRGVQKPKKSTVKNSRMVSTRQMNKD